MKIQSQRGPRAFLLLALACALAGCGVPPTANRCYIPTQAGSLTAQASAQMTVLHDAKPCLIRFRTAGDGYSSIAVIQQPQHGAVKVWTNETGGFAQYAPAPGYVGKDAFSLQLGETWRKGVAVDVLP